MPDVSSSLKDLKTRRDHRLEGDARHEEKCGSLGLSRKISPNLLNDTVESYTGLLHMAQDVSWMEHMNDVDLICAGLPPMTAKVTSKETEAGAGQSIA